jgi:hypothetical protein
MAELRVDREPPAREPPGRAPVDDRDQELLSTLRASEARRARGTGGRSNPFDELDVPSWSERGR